MNLDSMRGEIYYLIKIVTKTAPPTVVAKFTPGGPRGPMGPHGAPWGTHGAHGAPGPPPGVNLATTVWGAPWGTHGAPWAPPWGPRSAGFCFKARTSAMFFLGGPN